MGDGESFGRYFSIFFPILLSQVGITPSGVSVQPHAARATKLGMQSACGGVAGLFISRAVQIF